MTYNMLDSIKIMLSDDLMAMLSKFVGEDAAKTKSAMDSILPAILAGLIHKGSIPQGASDIKKMIDQVGIGDTPLHQLSVIFGRGSTTQNFLTLGKELASGIFGDRVTQVVAWIAGASGAGTSAGHSLLSLAVPMALGLLGNRVKESKLNAHGLMHLLVGQAKYLANQLPAGLVSAMGLSGPAHPVQGVGSAAPAGASISIWKWLIPLLIFILLLFLALRSCSSPPEVKSSAQGTPPAVKPTDAHARSGAAPSAEQASSAPAQTTAESVAASTTTAAQNAFAEAAKEVETLGTALTIKLPSGIELNVPELGVESKLVAFIADSGKPADTSTWFSLDRLEFETGRATLKPSSMAQLKNIAEILKAYPKVALKIGGYTDNTGNPDANLLLSQKRARSTKQELVKLGIHAARLEAEGYGEKHPLADNVTDEGRQKNRRIDIRVARK